MTWKRIAGLFLIQGGYGMAWHYHFWNWQWWPPLLIGVIGVVLIENAARGAKS